MAMNATDPIYPRSTMETDPLSLELAELLLERDNDMFEYLLILKGQLDHVVCKVGKHREKAKDLVDRMKSGGYSMQSRGNEKSGTKKKQKKMHRVFFSLSFLALVIGLVTKKSNVYTLGKPGTNPTVPPSRGDSLEMTTNTKPPVLVGPPRYDPLDEEKEVKEDSDAVLKSSRVENNEEQPTSSHWHSKNEKLEFSQSDITQRIAQQTECVVAFPEYVGNGACHNYVEYNTAACNWDGGDCCESTCQDAEWVCGTFGYYCKDPTATFSPSQSALPTQSPTTTRTHCEQKLPLSPVIDGSYDERASDIISVIQSISEPDLQVNIQSPQYQAACWIIHEDIKQVNASDVSFAQRYILAVLFYATDGLSPFLSRLDECDWGYGISCNDDGQVKWINLYDNNLGGSIPSELSKLAHLQWLSLQSNNIGGTIPPQLGEIKTLFALTLSNNNIVGTIPEELFDATNLENLYLGGNSITGTIPTAIGKLTSLTELSLHDNAIQGTIPENLYNLDQLTNLRIGNNAFHGSISTLIGSLTLLAACYLHSNEFSLTIPTEVGKLTNLNQLTLQDNQFSGAIPSQIGNSKELTIFRAANNLLSGRIPTELEALIHLSEFSLSNNQLTGPIPDEFEQLLQLTSFDVSRNHLEGNIPASMGNLTALKSLHLEGNYFEGDVPQDICDTLERKEDSGPFKGYHFSSDCGGDVYAGLLKCACCTHCFNEFSSHVPEDECQGVNITVVQEITNKGDPQEYQWRLIEGNASTPLLQDLYSVPLWTTESHNYSVCVSPTGCFTFDTDFKTQGYSPTVTTTTTTVFVNGKTIISNNYSYSSSSSNVDIIKFGFSSTQATLAQNSCDNYTVCGANAPEGSTKRSVFNMLVNMSSLKKFNDTTTAQHRAICWIIHQNKMDIDENKHNKVAADSKNKQRYVLALLHYMWKVWGELEPPSNHVCHWDGVKCNTDEDVISIDFSHKKLNGTLPLELGSLQTLLSLRLDHNALDGTVAIELGNLLKLKKLDLGNNAFHGTIPSEVSELPNLEILNFAANKISGTLPIKYASTLKVLNFSDNRFAGEIKISDASITSLEHLGLATNYFRGTIPLEISLASRLKTLHLQGNGLSGQIPESLSDLTDLTELRLQDNDLTGNIPTSLGMLTNLNMLLLSYNPISGPVPQEFQGLKRLSKLFLHGTQLTGTAPAFQGKESWEFISDCGSPSTSSSPLTCESCTVCCNAEHKCQDNEKHELSLAEKTYVFISAVFSILTLVMGTVLLLNKKKIIAFPELKRNVGTMVGEKSSYLFLITKSRLGRLLSLTTAILQVIIFLIFVNAAEADFSKDNDWEYTKRCLRGSLNCIDEANVDWKAWTIFSLLMIYGPVKDIANGMLLSYKGAMTRRYRCAFSGILLVILGTLAVWASAYYLNATATSTTELIKDSVILLVITDMDEKIFDLMKIINPTWVETMRRDAEMYSDELNATDNGDLCENDETTTSEHTKSCTYADDMIVSNEMTPL